MKHECVKPALRRVEDAGQGSSKGATICECLALKERINILEAEVSRLTEITQRDCHTGLLNGEGLRRNYDRLARALFRREFCAMSVVYIDLTGFKAVNDNLGHAGGDKVLQMVADAFKGKLRPTDSLARLHGDEFALILPGVSAVVAEGVVQKLRQAIGLIEILDGEIFDSPALLKLDLSFGVIELTIKDFRDFDEALRLADERMYESRGEGYYR